MNSKPDRFAITEGVNGINEYEPYAKSSTHFALCPARVRGCAGYAVPYAKSSTRFALCLAVVFALFLAGAAWFVTTINVPDAAAAGGAPSAQAVPQVDYLPSLFEKEEAAAPIVEQAPTF